MNLINSLLQPKPKAIPIKPDKPPCSYCGKERYGGMKLTDTVEGVTRTRLICATCMIDAFDLILKKKETKDAIQGRKKKRVKTLEDNKI